MPTAAQLACEHHWHDFETRFYRRRARAGSVCCMCDLVVHDGKPEPEPEQAAML